MNRLTRIGIGWLLVAAAVAGSVATAGAATAHRALPARVAAATSTARHRNTAGVILQGTFVTPNMTGTITYTPLRGFRGGSEGRYVIAGKAWPGSLYAATGGGTGMVWYYGTSGIMAGNALVTLQPDGTYAGPIWFFARNGATIDTGTVTVTFA